MMTSFSIRVNQGEFNGVVCGIWWDGPGATSGGATMFFARTVTEVDLESCEDFKEDVIESGVVVGMETTHGLAEELA